MSKATDVIGASEIGYLKASTVVQFVGAILLGVLVWIGKGISEDVDSLKRQMAVVETKIESMEKRTP